MTKIQFNGLTIVEQINFFNEKLKQGLNITQICSELSISYNTIRDRFTKSYYYYDKTTNSYTCSDKLFSIDLDNDLLESCIETIVNKVFENKKVQEASSNKLIIEPRTDKLVHRSFRIYENTLNNFIDFCSKSNYNQYDILSKIIDDAIVDFLTKTNDV